MTAARKDGGYEDPAPDDVIDEIEDRMGDDDLAGALLATNRELARTPDSIELHSLKGEILSSTGRYGEASAAYDRILELEPDDPEAWIHKSFVFLALDRPEDSLDAADRAIGLGLDDSVALVARAEALLELGRHGEAMKVVNDVLAGDPGHVDVLGLEAEILSAMGRHGEAAALLEKLSGWDPGSAEALVLLSGEHMMAGDFGRALEVADRAVALDGDDPAAWEIKGASLYELGRPEEALECILNAQDMDPAGGETWYQKARILAGGERDGALDALLVAVSINPDNKKRAGADGSFAGLRQDARFKKMTGP